MAIIVECPGCGKRYKLQDKTAGKRAKCACGVVMTVPAPHDADNRGAAPAESAGSDSDGGAHKAKYVDVELVDESSTGGETGAARAKGASTKAAAAPLRHSASPDTQRAATTVEPPGFFWFAGRVTLASPLTPEDVWGRLQNALPRIVVPPDRPGLFLRRRRVYAGSIRHGSFFLSGPRPITANKGSLLGVQGSIEQSGQGSLIHLRVYPVRAIGGLVLGWIVAILIPGLIWILDRSLSAGPLCPAAAFGLLGTVVYLFGRLGLGTELRYLLDYLQALFTDQGSAGDSPFSHR